MKAEAITIKEMALMYLGNGPDVLPEQYTGFCPPTVVTMDPEKHTAAD